MLVWYVFNPVVRSLLPWSFISGITRISIEIHKFLQAIRFGLSRGVFAVYIKHLLGMPSRVSRVFRCWMLTSSSNMRIPSGPQDLVMTQRSAAMPISEIDADTYLRYGTGLCVLIGKPNGCFWEPRYNEVGKAVGANSQPGTIGTRTYIADVCRTCGKVRRV